MSLSRKDFLLRSGSVALPLSLTGFSLGADQVGAPAGMEYYNVRKFGARGDGQAKETKAIQAAMDEAGRTGGTVYFPPGQYISGTIRFRNHVTIFLDAGATLIFSPDRGDFDPYEKLSFTPADDDETTDMHYALLRGQDVEHVGVTGPGRIDCNRKKRGGPKPIAFKNCRHVFVRDITIENSPNYNISLMGCDYVDIRSVTILNGYCDGIDPDSCRFVRITNCFVESWDDAIVPKASFALGVRRSTEHLTVTNCVLSSACSCFKLGTESCGDFKNITVSNCAMFGQPALWKRKSHAGVAVMMVDGARIERVTISNIAMVDVASPIFVRLGNRGRAQESPIAGSVQGVLIADLCAEGATLGSSVTGIPNHPVKQVALRNIRISSRGGGAAELARRQVHEFEGKYPNANMFGALPAHGLFCRHADELSLDNVSFNLETPDHRPALIVEQTSNLRLSGGSAPGPAGEEPAIWLRNVRGGFIQGLSALAGTKSFIKINGEKTFGIRALANDFLMAAQGIGVGKEVPEGVLRQEGNLLPV